MNAAQKKALETIEAPLQISLPGTAHRLPTQKEELEEALTILKKVKKEYEEDEEFLAILNDEEEWLNEGLELIEDENAITGILLDKFPQNATLKISNGNFPKTAEEIQIWKRIFSYIETQNPSDEDILQTIEEYRAFLADYDAKTANEFALQEIFDNIYTKEDRSGNKSAANKDEAMQAYILMIKPTDFPDIDDKLKKQLQQQIDGVKYVLDKFGVTSEELDSAIEKYISELEENAVMESPSENDSDSANEIAYEYVNKMYENLSYVDKEGNRWAASAKEVEEGYEYIRKAEESIEDTCDCEIKNLISQNREHLDEANTRRFAGAWWIIVCAGIVASFQLWQSFDTMGTRMSETEAVTYLEAETQRTQNTIDTYQARDVVTKDDEKFIEEKTEELAELKEITPEDYASKRNRNYIARGLKGLLGALISFAWIVGYYFAARPYGYDRFKRQKQYAFISKATGWTAKILSAILGFFWAMPITTYITKYTDGSTERSNDALGIFALQLIVTAIVVGMVLMVAKIIIPFVTIIAYVRNYPGKIGAKQINGMLGSGKGFVQEYIDKLKGQAKNAA